MIHVARGVLYVVAVLAAGATLIVMAAGGTFLVVYALTMLP
jgi:hypothetical protein